METETRKKRIPRVFRGEATVFARFFLRNRAFLFRVHRMWICVQRGRMQCVRFLFLLRLHRYKPSMMDDRSTTADFVGHGDNEELAKNARFLFHAMFPV